MGKSNTSDKIMFENGKKEKNMEIKEILTKSSIYKRLFLK